LEFFLQISIKDLSTKFHDNASSGSGYDACGQNNGQKQRQTDVRTDVQKLIVSLRLNANASKNGQSIVPNSPPVPLAKLLSRVLNS
jgi:hypothetical protein